ncbi:MAG: translation initiation factor IF-2 [Candidatus Eisenbacteria bacterium]
MARKRVYQVARDFDLSSEALVEMLKSMGVAVKSHMSAIDDETVTRLGEKLRLEKEEVKKEEARKKQIVEKVEIKEKPEPKPAEPPKRVGTRRRVDEKSVKESVRKTLAEIDGKKVRRRKRKSGLGEDLEEDQGKVIRVTEFISVGELASVLGVKPAEVVTCCMRLGVMATINQRLDADTIETIADEFDYAVEFIKEYGAEIAEEEESAEVSRHPVVTIMGHVDHGKTSLLDYVRSSKVVAGESGGITQHIGAYEVETTGGRLTFLDTPGHEAFTAMRARGAQATDIVVLVVAANERVMPQTIEAIDHAKAAEVPIIVAINKIDLPDANVDRIKQELASNGLTPDDWGGNVLMVPVSAKRGDGVEHLLEMILLQAEMLALKAPSEGRATGVVIESRVEQGRGIVITVLIQKGELRSGDPFVAGVWQGKVRAMFNERRKNVDLAHPSSPVEVLGSNGVPQAGDSFMVTRDDREAREISAKRQLLQREKDLRKSVHISLQDLYARIQAGEIKELRVVTKGDVDGSVEALSDSLQKLGSDKVSMKVIHRGVGPVNESDVLLAAASDAIVVGFHVGVLPKAREIAKREQVDVRTYNIIYEVTEDIQAAMEGLLGPVMEEKVTGNAEVRKVFGIRRVGTIAGCYVTDGTLVRNGFVRVLRNGELVVDGKISSLKRFKDDAKQVTQGYECGVGVEGFDDLQEGDVIQAYVLEEVKRS